MEKQLGLNCGVSMDGAPHQLSSYDQMYSNMQEFELGMIAKAKGK